MEISAPFIMPAYKGLSSRRILRLIETIPRLDRQFLNVFPRDRLPPVSKRLPCCFIVNSDTANLPGTHWTAVYIDSDNCGFYFDSFGFLPPPRLQRWLNYYTRRWFYNSTCFQQPTTFVCAYYCIYFLYQMSCGVAFQTIIDRLSTSGNPDRYMKSFFGVDN